MIDWLKTNMINIAVLTVIFLYGWFCIKSIRSDKEKGKPTCGGNCAYCSLACHRPKKTQ